MAEKTQPDQSPATDASATQIADILARLNAQQRDLDEAKAKAAEAEARAQAAEAQSSALLAKRAASSEEPENSSAVIMDEAAEGLAMDDLMAAQETFKVFLHQNDEGQPQLPRETVQINGSKIWNVMRGEDVEVPESVYMVLVQAGLTRPQREADYDSYPRKAVKPGKAAPVM